MAYTYTSLVWKPEEKDYLGDLDVDVRLVLKTDMKEVGCEDRDWINLARDTVQRRLLWTR
jgi:hypothetical protein